MNHLRYACLAMFYVTVAYATYRNERLPWTGRPEWPAAELLIHFACGLLLLAACVSDAKARRHPLTNGTTLTACATLPLSMVVYLIWSRGGRGILWLAVNLFFSVVVGIAAASVANAVTGWQIEAIDAVAEQQPPNE